MHRWLGGCFGCLATLVVVVVVVVGRGEWFCQVSVRDNGYLTWESMYRVAYFFRRVGARSR